LVVPTSGGKTIATASLSALCNERTLVLCKTNLIKKAWQDDLQKLYGFDPKKDLGLIQQKTVKLGKHITLASTATLNKREHLFAEIFGNIGMLIIDEAHIIGSDSIDKIVSNCPCKYIVGATATPTRTDKKHYLVYGHLGRPVLRIKNTHKETDSSLPLADAKIVRTMYEFRDEEGKRFDPEVHMASELGEHLSLSQDRNNLIAENVFKDWKAGHSVLVAMDRLAHLDILKKMLREAGIRNVQCIHGAINSRRTKQKEVLDQIMSRKCRCVLATKAAIKLGANINPLDRLHIAVPTNKGDMEQLIGRIRRKHPSKKDAVLTVYRDVDWFLSRKLVSNFYPVMRKLQVARYANAFVA
jgi:superfamily II DNA or RNA helicase